MNTTCFTNKLIMITILMGLATPVFAYNGQYDFTSNSPAVRELDRTIDREEEQRSTCTYTPCYSPDVNPPITQVQYPGALDPQRNLPAWVYNP